MIGSNFIRSVWMNGLYDRLYGCGHIASCISVINRENIYFVEVILMSQNIFCTCNKGVIKPSAINFNNGQCIHS